MPTLELSFACEERSLSVRRFSIHEGISTLFTVSVWARSNDPSLDLSAIVGRPASLRVISGYQYARLGGARLWTGICSYMEQLQAEPTGLSTYYLRIVPSLWLLGQRRNYRIFQHQSIPDIIGRLLDEHSIEHVFRIEQGRYPKLEYQVQYGETDYAFVCRLLEEAGIAFTFPDDDEKGSRLTLSDEPHLAAPRPGPPLPYVDSPNQAAELEFVTHLRLWNEVRPGIHTIRDHDFRNPAYALFGGATRAEGIEVKAEQYHYRPGAFLVETGAGGETPAADDKGVARYDQPFGRGLAERALLGERVGKEGLSFDTNAIDLWPGMVLSVDGHPHAMLPTARKLLVTEFSIDGSHGEEWHMSATAVFTEAPYRPPQRTPKPRVRSFQSATVVGPKGQEIHTDEFGRVRVQFPWDRHGTSDDESSCWMRVSQGWGGMGYGALTLPRVGQEVLIELQQGDPDQPLIAGRLFNARQPVPYRLPEHKTRSAWKSDSSPGSGGFNEIMFEDKKGQELVFEQAQRDRRALVKNDEITTVGHDLEKLVKHDESERTDGYHRMWVSKNLDSIVAGQKRDLVTNEGDLHVHHDRREQVIRRDSLAVLGDRHARAGKNYALSTGREAHMRAGEELIGEGEDVTAKGPGGFLRIDASGVTLNGALIRINNGGSPGRGAGSRPDMPLEPPAPRVVNLRWDKPRAKVGETVQLSFTTQELRGGEAATVTVFECNADGSKKVVSVLQTTIEKPSGEHRLSWLRREDEVAADLHEDESEADPSPLEYRFEVSAGLARSEEPSGPLWLTNTVHVDLTTEEGATLNTAEMEVTLTAADGAVLKATTKEGRVTFEDVVVGPISITAEIVEGEA